MYYQIVQVSTGKVIAKGKGRIYRKRHANHIEVYISWTRALTRKWDLAWKLGISHYDLRIVPQ